MVRVPTVAEEDARRTHRERKRLVKEHTGHINRIQVLLALHGIIDYGPIKADRWSRLHALVTRNGQPLRPRCAASSRANSTAWSCTM
jgi:transposase